VGVGLYAGHATQPESIVSMADGGYLSATLTVCEPHTAWTISRSIGLSGCVGESVAGVLTDHLQRVR